jgi:hypothetical protein
MKQLNFNKQFNGLANALNLIPENHKLDKNTFIMSDGNESYKIRWEGTVNEGRAIMLESTNKKDMNESMNKIKHLFAYNSKDTLGKLKGDERINEDNLFFESLNKVKSLVNEDGGQLKSPPDEIHFDKNVSEDGSSGKSDMAKIIYFGYNYPHDFVTKIWGDNNIGQHLQNKFLGYYKDVGAGAAFFKFFVNLDRENQQKLEEFISTNYRG